MVKSVESPQTSGHSEPPSSKRKKTEEHEGNGSKKKPRTRVSYSCGECHRRKQKCDRQVPCSHCVARKVPELCKAYTPGKSDQDIHLRLARLEHIIEAALPQYAGPSTPGSPSIGGPISGGRHGSRSPSPDDDNGSQAEEQDPGAGTFQSGKWYGNSASGSVAPASVLEQLQHVASPGESQDEKFRESIQSRFEAYSNETMSPTERFGVVGKNLHNNIQTATFILDSVRQGAEPTAADNLQSLVQDCGVSPHKLTELIKELPPMQTSDVLVDYYFKSINWTRYPVSESDFLTSYRSIYANGLAANPSDIRFLPLLFVTLAIAVRLAPEHIGGDAHTRRINSLRKNTARRSLLIAVAIQPDSLDMVLIRLLSARFLTFDRRITECWSQLGAAVRTAQALGLHRDGAAMGMDPAHVEYRRRIWAYLYHADRSYALVLGRPNAIQDDYTSTLPPLNIENLSGLSTKSHPVSPPLSTPTGMTFVILRHALAAIIGRMVHHFQQVRVHSHYSDVLAIDEELQQFIDTLPPHFAVQPDTSLDAIETYIPVHRFLLITEILFVRISLHRPYLLRRLGSDRYVRSRRACFMSAMVDFEVRQAFRKAMPREVLESMSNAYREFQTAMVSGIYLVLDPNGKEADAMHAILDGFLKDHEGVGELDETTRRELKIIEFLKSKASLAEGRGQGRRIGVDGPLGGGNSDQSMDAQANLLLSLQQSRSPSSMSQLRPPHDGAPPSMHPPFNLSLTTRTPPITHSTPIMNSPTSMSHKPQSPTFQRVQGEAQPHARHSPAGSGSPGAEEEPSAAQSLLDHWCNTVSNGPLADGFANGALPGQWSAFAGTGDVSGWLAGGVPYLLGGPGELGTLNGVEGSDYSYWENLVNQIRGGPL